MTLCSESCFFFFSPLDNELFCQIKLWFCSLVTASSFSSEKNAAQIIKCNSCLEALAWKPELADLLAGCWRYHDR